MMFILWFSPNHTPIKYKCPNLIAFTSNKHARPKNGDSWPDEKGMMKYICMSNAHEPKERKIFIRIIIFVGSSV